MLEFFLILSIMAYSAFFIFFMIKIWNSVEEHCGVIPGLLNYIKDIYAGRNWFGVLLSSGLVLLLVPCFIATMALGLIAAILVLLTNIWYLGDKKEDC